MDKTLWIVKLNETSTARLDQERFGFLACGQRIAAYTRGEALKKARMFSGTAIALETFSVLERE